MVSLKQIDCNCVFSGFHMINILLICYVSFQFDNKFLFFFFQGIEYLDASFNQISTLEGLKVSINFNCLVIFIFTQDANKIIETELFSIFSFDFIY